MKTLSEYQQQARRSANTAPSIRVRRLVGALGLAGEAGEVADLVKKFEGHGHPVNKERLTEELGDVLWCISNVATLYGLELDDIATSNIEKLQHRYPNGFESSRSRCRDEKT